MCCACVENRHVCLQLLLSKVLSCHVQNFTIVADIHETYSTWSSFVSVVNHCLFSTVCGGGLCGYALFRHGGGLMHGEWRLGKFVSTWCQHCGMIVSWNHGMAVLCQRLHW